MIINAACVFRVKFRISLITHTRLNRIRMHLLPYPEFLGKLIENDASIFSKMWKRISCLCGGISHVPATCYLDQNWVDTGYSSCCTKTKVGNILNIVFPLKRKLPVESLESTGTETEIQRALVTRNYLELEYTILQVETWSCIGR